MRDVFSLYALLTFSFSEDMTHEYMHIQCAACTTVYIAILPSQRCKLSFKKNFHNYLNKNGLLTNYGEIRCWVNDFAIIVTRKYILE